MPEAGKVVVLVAVERNARHVAQRLEGERCLETAEMEDVGFVEIVVVAVASDFERLVLRLSVASLQGMGSLRYWAPSVGARPYERL